MNFKGILMGTATVAGFLTSNTVYAGCSQQEAMNKGMQLSQIVQKKMAQDPTAGQTLMMRMQPIMQENQAKMISGGSTDWDTVCTEYDALIKQAQ